MSQNPPLALPAIQSKDSSLVVDKDKEHNSSNLLLCVILGVSLVKNQPVKTYVPMPNKWRLCEVRGRRPEAREGATFTRLSVRLSPHFVEDRLYMFGGLSRDLLSNISYFRLGISGNL